MSLEPAVFVSAIAACISAVSALVAVWNFRREQLNQRIAAAKWKKEYFSDLLKWSDEAMLLLSESLHLCDLDPKRMEDNRFFEVQHTLRVKLSAQIDRGRWFFPNYAVEQHGTHKSTAFRGYRPEVLDGLVHAYRAVSSINYVEQSKNRQHRPEIEAAKRLFTSEIQRVLDPRSRDEEFKKLLTSVEAA
ncbi:hypothetical protein NX871_27720 [Burkholderia thailandensis]|uniref:hypothetical protein n=1 Tax=Burkholderia thailandensis TaxID=57975 RepID=UPI00217E1749|nr:hypothetical protein [Burkholderia thailandensis]MCS6473702.1 hypothetical protein [Burkholderia thailandensis]